MQASLSDLKAHICDLPAKICQLFVDAFKRHRDGVYEEYGMRGGCLDALVVLCEMKIVSDIRFYEFYVSSSRSYRAVVDSGGGAEWYTS